MTRKKRFLLINNVEILSEGCNIVGGDWSIVNSTKCTAQQSMGMVSCVIHAFVNIFVECFYKHNKSNVSDIAFIVIDNNV